MEPQCEECHRPHLGYAHGIAAKRRDIYRRTARHTLEPRHLANHTVPNYKCCQFGPIGTCGHIQSISEQNSSSAIDWAIRGLVHMAILRKIAESTLQPLIFRKREIFQLEASRPTRR